MELSYRQQAERVDDVLMHYFFVSVSKWVVTTDNTVGGSEY